MTENVLPMPMSAPNALKLIRSIAADTFRVVLSDHGKKRMVQRRYDMGQIYACLRHGVIKEGPTLDVKNYWRCRLERLAAGQEIAVVVAFNTSDRLIIVTVI